MFTGIITDIGQVLGASSASQGEDLQVRIGTGADLSSLGIGASIACDGICLTVVATGSGACAAAGQDWFEVDISAETVAKTALHRNPWSPGRRLNLERALRLGDELGGHLVSGHVDGVAEVLSVGAEGFSTRIRLQAPPGLAKFIAPKGSVALNGTSLTVNVVDGDAFGINLIPHTLQATTWGGVKPGDPVNLEIDTLARYVARLNSYAG